jgi:general stress protein 26
MASQKKTDTNMPDKAPTKAERLKEFNKLVDDMKIGMLVTHTADGSLVSRAMATQERRPDVDLWFVTSTETEKVDELEANSEVNVSFLNPSTREWVSIAGTATVNTDRNLIRQLYKPDWGIWFPKDENDKNAGGPEDRRIVLIDVDAHTVDYFKSQDSRPVSLFKVAKAFATGKTPEFGDTQHISK